MVVPWLGFPLRNLIAGLNPTSKANYVEFTTLNDLEQMPGLRRAVLECSYIEALRMDEAMHPLTLLVSGLYGKPLPNQNGAPLRLIVPWKYGFKGGKSIIKIRFRASRPATTWNIAAPREYGFYANVNPSVDHPRWSQARERRAAAAVACDYPHPQTDRLERLHPPPPHARTVRLLLCGASRRHVRRIRSGGLAAPHRGGCPGALFGALAFVLLVPLAVTSTKGWIRRLGSRWQKLHRLVYVAAISAVLHFLLAVKLDIRKPLAEAGILLALFGIRALLRRRGAPRRLASPGPAPSAARGLLERSVLAGRAGGRQRVAERDTTR